MVRLEDSGLYECQANTEPKRQFSVEVVVEDTVAVISGPREVFLVAGSTLRLHCTVWLGDRKWATDTLRPIHSALVSLTCHLSSVNCHLSSVICHLSSVNCQLSHLQSDVTLQEESEFSFEL